MFSNFKYGTPQNEIGEIVNVIAGNNANETILNTSGKFVRTNGIYNQADYPELFQRIGLHETSQWTPRTSGTTSSISTLTYGNGLYVYGGVGGVLRTSTDGTTWTSRTSGTTSNILDLTYGNGLYVYSTTGTIRTSTDGITWTSRTSGTTTNIRTLTYGNGLYVYGGDGGVLSTSTDGITWTPRTSGTTTNILALAYGNGLYVYGGNGGVLRTSTDAITWTARSVGISNVAFSAITYGNGIFAAIGSFLFPETGINRIFTSTDGITWNNNSYGRQITNYYTSTGSSEFRSSPVFYDLTYGNGIFVAACSDRYGDENQINYDFGTIYVSTDCITWTEQLPFPYTYSFYNAATYGNGLYVVGGGNGILRTSTTAKNIEYSPNYNASTQFYVPNYTGVTRFYTLPTYTNNSSPRFINYMRAK